MNGQKTGGRQKGTPNKITTEIREFLASLVFDNMDLIKQDVRNMTTEQRAAFLPKILPYIAPKMKPKAEKDEQDIASERFKNFLSLAQMVDKWEEENDEQTDADNIPTQNNTTSNEGIQPLEQPRTMNLAESQYPDAPVQNNTFSNEEVQPLEQPHTMNPAEESDLSYPSDSSNKLFPPIASANPVSPAPSVKLVKQPTKPAPQRQHTPFYRNVKTKRTLKKRR